MSTPRSTKAQVSRTKELLLNAATAVVALCTVAMTGITLWRQFTPSQGRDPFRDQPPVLVEGWASLTGTGHRSGPQDAAITVLVFSDFECPACAVFATRTYPAFRERHGGRTALVYRHWPLSGHRLAYPAARASECAAAQGRFQEFHDLLFARQAELGARTFREFALDAGVPDAGAFDACFGADGKVAAVERDVEAARSVGGMGTPTVLVNGWLLRGAVSVERLDSLARRSLPSRGSSDR